MHYKYIIIIFSIIIFSFLLHLFYLKGDEDDIKITLYNFPTNHILLK